MNKYEVFLSDNYNSDVPFMTDWDYELIGDKFRAEFDEYFEQQQKLAGKSARLFRGEFVKKFMILKRINLVDDPANNNLKSVFILRKGEKKSIDERAKNSLAPRFEYKTKATSTGELKHVDGFMKFTLTEGSEKVEVKKGQDLQVEGNDIQYFQETPEVIEEKEQEKEVFVCEECGREFDSAKALRMHGLSHRKK